MANFSRSLTDVFLIVENPHPVFTLQFPEFYQGKILMFAIVKVVKEFEGVSFRG